MTGLRLISLGLPRALETWLPGAKQCSAALLDVVAHLGTQRGGGAGHLHCHS